MQQSEYVAQGLLKTWKAEKSRDTSTSGVIPLIPWMEYQYKERYVKLCERLGVEPVSFAKWLCKPISSIVWVQRKGAIRPISCLFSVTLKFT